MIARERRADSAHGSDDERDAGFTLIEIMASMVMMTIFLTMFSASMVQLYGSSNKTNAINDSSTQINLAFLRLDREIRYAAAIDTPGGSDANSTWYVEFLTQNTGVEVCTQLRVADGVLSERTAPTSATVPPDWNALASGISNTTDPFTFVSVISTANASTPNQNQQLTVSLQSTSGASGASTTSSTKVTFSALNSNAQSSTETPGTQVCPQFGRT